MKYFSEASNVEFNFKNIWEDHIEIYIQLLAAFYPCFLVELNRANSCVMLCNGGIGFLSRDLFKVRFKALPDAC